MKSRKTKGDGPNNVFEDLGFSRQESLLLSLKAQLAALIVRVVHERGLKQKELGALWGVPQPRMSEVMTGKLSLVSVDRLAAFLGALGIELVVRAKPVIKGTQRRAG
jgi:predicted XRE-type DNA-binding protein